MAEQDHVHDCTGADMTCPCGYKFSIPPICVSIEITNGPHTVINEGFNCSDMSVAIKALMRVAQRLEQAS